MPKRILVSRDPDRADHSRHLKEATRDCLSFNIYKKYPDSNSLSDGQLYWSHFSTPHKILEFVQPEKIVFSDVENFYEVALNIAARKRGIPTYALEHGLRYAEEVEVARASPLKSALGRSEWRSASGLASRAHTLRFYLSVFKDCNLSERLKLLEFLYIRSTTDMTVALNDCPFELRLADNYINYSVGNTGYLISRDKVPVSRFRLIGNPALDDLFQESATLTSVSDDPFYLLLDSPLVEVESIGMPGEVKRTFLEKLNVFAKSKRAKLFVKLHPYSYVYGFSDSYLPNDPNIVYCRDVPLGPLISRAEGCFGLLSTLLTAAPCLNRCIIFRLPNQPFQDELIRRGVVGGLDFDAFRPEDIKFEAITPSPAVLEEFVEFYLFKADGKATDRLRELLCA